MKNSKLIEILKKLSAHEIERLKAFMVSPYFIKQKSLSTFASMLLNEFPHFQSDKISENYLYEKLYPGLKYKQQTINDLMTLMMASFKQFLAFENFQTDETESTLRILEELRNRDLDKEFINSSRKLYQKLENGKKDADYYFKQMRFENELEHFSILNKEHLGHSQFLQNKADALDKYYIATKLKIACDMINRENVFSSKYTTSFLDEVLSYLHNNTLAFEAYPAISIYYRIILTLIKPEEESHFHNLKILLETNANNFPIDEIKEMYAFANNYCIKKINGGKMEYSRELFSLYRKAIETGVIYDNGHLSQWNYKNIVTVGLRLQEHDWIENFIHTAKDQIPYVFREMAWSHAIAHLYYEKKSYSKAVKMLNKFNNELKQIQDSEFEDTFYILDSRVLLLKIYYELDEEEPLIAAIDAFKLFLNRNKKISERQKNGYLNLIKYTRKLNDLRHKFIINRSASLKLFEELKNRIDSEPNIISLGWLKTCLENFENGIQL